MTRVPKFWDCRDSEILTHTDPDEAIYDYLSDGGDTPDELVVKGYAPRELPDANGISDWGLDHLLEDLDEDYGRPDDYTNANDAMKEAWITFVRVVLSEYEVWQCEVVTSYSVNVEQWIKDNQPEWIEDGKE